MENFLINLFFLFAVFPLFLEVMALLGFRPSSFFNKYVKELEGKVQVAKEKLEVIDSKINEVPAEKEISSKEFAERVLELSDSQKEAKEIIAGSIVSVLAGLALIFLSVGYLVWMFFGLFTPQYQYFLIMFGLSFLTAALGKIFGIESETFKIWQPIDNIITIAILLVVIMSHMGRI